MNGVTSISSFKSSCHKEKMIDFLHSFPVGHCNQITTTLYIPTTRHIHPILPQTLSKDQAHLPPSLLQKTPYQGFWRVEVHTLRLRIRFVRQGLVCVHSDELYSYLLTWVCIFNDSHRSTLHTFVFVSFVQDRRHMMCAHF
jgi:hypothetical protein